ncbi:MAG: RelA/SpoT family protein [Coxiellaceae bacterium]|nr:RelA/SpoT family protein [Coxiellaceae bacterium]
MRLFKKLRRKLGYLDEEQIELIHQAYLTAMDAHRTQKRVTGEPYITHPVEVACILADMRMDYQTIMSALLHDVIEDTPVSKSELAHKFGDQVAELVDGVSKLTQIEFVSRAEMQAENFRKMVLAMAKDIRVILVKLSDRLHNMRTLGSLRPAKRNRIATETLEIYAPIAKRLGMREYSVELEELGFQARYPHRYSVLKEAVRKARGNRKKILNVINKALYEGLDSSDLPACVINGREKHLYSIYRKMSKKHIPFNEIMDVYAFRIIVDRADTCYRVLGVVHSLFKPVPGRFKDYIAIPKANGYQSLHTTLFGPYGLPIEIQIRTTEMDRMATNGIAAHWLYKSGEQSLGESHSRAQQWVHNLLELQQSTGSSLEFIESVKVDLFPDEVYVFTPKGDIRQLPAHSTAIDFAYSVHTDVGNSCVAVKINRQLAPLSSVLSNGQTVEVITSNMGRPNPSWMDFVVTSKARSGIRHFLKNQHRTDSIALGKQLLKKSLSVLNLSLRGMPAAIMDDVLAEAQVETVESLFEDIGLGNRVAALVAQRIAMRLDESEQPKALPEPDSDAPMLIKGTEGMLLDFAECCHPIPGDPIVGTVIAGQGVTVHRDDCKRIAKLQQKSEFDCVPLRWAENISREFPVIVVIEVINRRGVLAVAALAVSDADANIDDIRVTDEAGSHYLISFKLLVRDRMHLAKVLRRLRQVKDVTRIVRRK